MNEMKYRIGDRFIGDKGYVLTIENYGKDSYEALFYKLHSTVGDILCHEDYLDRLERIITIK